MLWGIAVVCFFVAIAIAACSRPQPYGVANGQGVFTNPNNSYLFINDGLGGCNPGYYNSSRPYHQRTQGRGYLSQRVVTNQNPSAPPPYSSGGFPNAPSPYSRGGMPSAPSSVPNAPMPHSGPSFGGQGVRYR
jgi:hypothetical protein